MRAPRIDALVWRQDRGGRGAWRAEAHGVGVIVVPRRTRASGGQRGEVIGWTWEIRGDAPCGGKVEQRDHAATMEQAQRAALARVPAVVRAVKALVKP